MANIMWEGAGMQEDYGKLRGDIYGDNVNNYHLGTMPSANAKQVGGNHYKQFTNFEPWDVITAWNLGYLDGTALKYIARWKHKNGIEDLEKAVHFLQKAIEVEKTKSREFIQAPPWKDV